VPPSARISSGTNAEKGSPDVRGGKGARPYKYREPKQEDRAGPARTEEEPDERRKVRLQGPGGMSGELVFAGTRVEVKTLVDYLRVGHTLDDFLEGFPTVFREQAEAYLETTPEADR
jgi:uncharacterized protein (DUF433 family)